MNEGEIMAGPVIYLICKQISEGKFSETMALQVNKGDTEKQAAERFARFALNQTPVGKISDEVIVFVRKNMNDPWKKFRLTASVVVKMEIEEIPITEPTR